MPLPKPTPSETRHDFIKRCMDDATMKAEFPQEDQRLAACFIQWRDRNKSEPSYETKLARLEFKFDAEKRIIEGHASIFDTLDLVGDIIHKGAFKKTIKERLPDNRVKFRFMHRDPIGKVLDLSEDSVGLAFEARISRTTLGDDVATLIQDEAVDAMSIGYRAKVVEFDEDDLDPHGWPIRHIKEVNPLLEISAVDLGAHPDARIENVKDEALAAFERRIEALERGLDIIHNHPKGDRPGSSEPELGLDKVASLVREGLGDLASLLRT